MMGIKARRRCRDSPIRGIVWGGELCENLFDTLSLSLMRMLQL